jgi:hypothetical protein
MDLEVWWKRAVIIVEHLGLDGCREDAHCLDVFWGSDGIEEHEAFSAIGLWLLEESLDTKEGVEFLREVEDIVVGCPSGSGK